MVSRILKGAAVMLSATAFASTASAGCGGSTYCSSSASMAPLSTWAANSNNTYTYESSPSTAHSSLSYSSYAPAATYSSASSYVTSSSYGSSYGGMMSTTEADAKYGTGSISNAYEGGDVELYGFSGSTASVAGLGYNESLQMTNCPTNVYNPNGGRVLGCYNVVKPVPQTNYVRVVRPIVYVRYPVPTPVAVPTYAPCNVITHHSRYGGRAWNQGLGYGHGRRCG